MKIGYLGPKSSFTYAAAKTAFPEAELLPFNTIPACITAYFEQALDYVVVPIENSIEGSVHPAIDQLYHHVKLPVQGEVVMRIQQQLMVNPKNKTIWQEAHKVISHPQAIAQSQSYLNRYFPDAIIEAAPSTTNGAKRVAESTENIAAIGSKQAAQEYGLMIVGENIQDAEYNQTRFWILGEKGLQLQLEQSDQKQSMALTLPSNQPGSLHGALSAFSWRKIDLTKIESRPLKTHLGEYFFLIDLKADQPQELVDNAIKEIELIGGIVKEFGRYPVYTLKP